MPKREDIRKILVIGSGPIIIAQAAEFDYSGSQACKALRELGYEVVLVNSNPATIQTDKEIADKIYIEPLVPEIIEEIIRKEKIDAILPTMGGQTGLNIALELYKRGTLEKYGVKVLGSNIETIMHAEDREKFAELMKKIGEPIPESKAVNSVEEAKKVAKEIGYPVIIRPAYTLGGTGGGVAYNEIELENIVKKGLKLSIINQVLIEKSLLGYYEFEFEVMRDCKDNCIIVCGMENFDPMGIHTGESIVVAPIQTLRDEEYQILRNAAIKIIRALKIEGGCNIQFAVNPKPKNKTFEYYVIEVNPRVSRSSALASKATGYPIAKIAAKLAVGLSLDEVLNDITKRTTACFEPTLDYVVVKIPRWPFDKFKDADRKIGTQMKSTGEVMAIGRSFEEALQKAIRSLDIKRYGICADGRRYETDIEVIKEKLKNPTDERLFYIYDAIRLGISIEEIHELTGIHPFFLYKIKNICEMEKKLERMSIDNIDAETLREAKKLGFSDKQLAYLLKTTEEEIRKIRKKYKIEPVYKFVDTCAAEFEAATPYYYSTYCDNVNESKSSKRKKILIIGSGPIRIGQGIEFDYCCVHAVKALKEEGIEAIIINNNPETVSTDYDVSDKLYFEPITFEDVMNVIEHEKPDGVILQFGGQTPINLALDLDRANVKILGTQAKHIDIAEDREKFAKLLNSLGINYVPYGIAYSKEEAKAIIKKIGFPVLLRPSYVLGGRGMEIIYDEKSLEEYFEEAVKVSEDKPVIIDKFLEDAIEIDVDAISDGEDVFIAGILEHIEHAGVHSGDSCMVLPPQSISEDVIKVIKDYTIRLAKALNIKGLFNIQMAVKDNKVYVLEVNPRASRTVPFVSKAINIPLVKIATKILLGKKLKDFNLGSDVEVKMDYICIKESVFSFIKLPGIDPVLGPEMKSTGEVMGIDYDFGVAYYKSQLAADNRLPINGRVFISVRDEDKVKILDIAREFINLGFEILATRGTGKFLIENGIPCKIVKKVSEGRPNVVDLIINKEVDLIINTPTGGKKQYSDGYKIRRAAVDFKIPYITTITAAKAAVLAIKSIKKNNNISVKSLEEYYSKRLKIYRKKEIIKQF